MSTQGTTADAMPDYAPIPQSSFGPAVNDKRYYVGRVERNLYWVTDGVYQAAFLTTQDGVVLFDAPPSARTVPLVPTVVPIVDRWSAGKSPGEWLFAAPAGGPLRETNWQRAVGWREAKATIGRPELRVSRSAPHGGLGVAGIWR